MSSVAEKHRKAMELAEKAYLLRVNYVIPELEHLSADQVQAEHDVVISEAARLEYEACMMLPVDPESEPTWSIMHTSAASLAVQANRPDRAFQMAARGLIFNPAEYYAFELMRILTTVFPKRNG